MAFIKRQSSARFTMIPNSIYESGEFGIKEMGMLSFLLHLPDNWDFSIEGLAKVLKNDGKTTIMSTLNKLEEKGYLARFQSKNGGRFGESVWVVSDTKLTASDLLEITASLSEIMSSETPSSENRTQNNTNRNIPIGNNTTQGINNNKRSNSIIGSKTKENNTIGDFDVFWKAYPRKLGKESARKAFAKIRDVSLETMLNALEVQKNTEQWTKDNGQFIPYPSTWLNQRRWEDEIQEEYLPSTQFRNKKMNGNPFAEMLREGVEIVSEQNADHSAYGDAENGLSVFPVRNDGKGDK